MPSEQTHMVPGLLTTREVARKVGVAPSTIRMWKQRQLLRPAAETPAGDYWELESVRQVALDIQVNRKGGRLRGATARVLAASQASAVVDAVLATAAAAARAAGDTATERWLCGLLERGERAASASRAAEAKP